MGIYFIKAPGIRRWGGGGVGVPKEKTKKDFPPRKPLLCPPWILEIFQKLYPVEKNPQKKAPTSWKF